MDPTQVRVAEFSRNVIPTLFLHRSAVRFGLRKEDPSIQKMSSESCPNERTYSHPEIAYSKKAARFLELRNTRFKRRVSGAPTHTQL